ncbi:MAG: NUDIX hydrolase, partial [Deltaproteobacteria bacterium]|nr:NUDIX hydrolase [Deltaproteobacteria bacterium]
MTKTISRTELRSGPIGRYGLEEAELPNGHRMLLDVLRHPGAAAAVVFASPSRLLLLRQYRHAGGGWLWEIPAGKLDPGEQPLACIEREIEEETGYRAARVEYLGEILTAAAYTDERIRLYLAADLIPGTMAHGRGEN